MTLGEFAKLINEITQSSFLTRREKQLKRMIEAARAWMRTARDYEDCANQATEAYLGLPPGPEENT